MIFLQRKINTLPHRFPSMPEDSSMGFFFLLSGAVLTAALAFARNQFSDRCTSASRSV
jgi:hypothetical protein